MLWQDLKVKRYFVWVYQGYLVNLVRLKDFLLISLTNITYKFLNVGTMGRRTQIFMASEIEQIEVGLISQVIQMRKRLNHLQV
jgi:hypothetical protein